MKYPGFLVTTIVVAVAVHGAVAQSEPKAAAKDPSGFTPYAAFGGTSNNQGQIYELSTSVGYDFNRHFAANLGVPFYFIRPSSLSSRRWRARCQDPSCCRPAERSRSTQ